MTPDFETEAESLVAVELARGRTGYVEEYRRLFGSLPWEDTPDVIVQPSPPAELPSMPDELEQAANPVISPETAEVRRDPSPVAAAKPVERHPRPLPKAGDILKLERGPCRHPLAAILTTAMPLVNVRQVDCSTAGCGCRVYSDRGPLECPCHWPAARAAAVGRTLQAQLAGAVR